MLKKVREASFAVEPSSEKMEPLGSKGKEEEKRITIKKKKLPPRPRITDFGGITFTITFSNAVENHAGMEIISVKESRSESMGYSFDELVEAYYKFKEAGGDVDFVDLRSRCGIDATQYADDPESYAYVLVVYNGCDVLKVDPDSLYREQLRLEYDSKAFMKGRVVNKHARHNLCFTDQSSPADFENKKGTVVSFSELPRLKAVREKLSRYIPRSTNLLAEGNKYYDIQKCYIGPHGDKERDKIVGVRLGETFPLHYQYYHRTQPVSDIYTMYLPHGSLYVMDRKAGGKDWRSSSILTIRHSAGDIDVIRKNSKR